MSLSHLYKNHDQDKENYNALRDKIWKDIKERHQSIAASFPKDNLPDQYSKQFEADINKYNEEWAMPSGSHYKTMILKHEQEIAEIAKSVQPDNKTNNEPILSRYEQSLASTKQAAKEQDNIKDLSRARGFEQNRDDLELER